jgi:hypothetical protein
VSGVPVHHAIAEALILQHSQSRSARNKPCHNTAYTFFESLGEPNGKFYITGHCHACVLNRAKGCSHAAVTAYQLSNQAARNTMQTASSTTHPLPPPTAPHATQPSTASQRPGRNAPYAQSPTTMSGNAMNQKHGSSAGSAAPIEDVPVGTGVL